MTDEAPISTVDAAASMNKVADKKAVSKKSLWYWILGGILFFILLTLLFSHHKNKQAQQAEQRQVAQEQVQAELQENLAKLQAMNAVVKQKLQQAPQVVQAASQEAPPKLSKDMLARMSAPTKVYAVNSQGAGSVENNTNTAQGQSSTSTTLGDKSDDASFANQATAATSVEATSIAHPSYTIAEGELMHGVLETAVNSDLPGMVRAVITQPVYAYVGEQPLIPAGSRLIGQYSSGVVLGQRRVMIIWNRVILPSGITVQIDSPGADALGQAGQGADSFNTHFFARFGQAVLLSILGAGASTAGVSSDDDYNSAAEYRSAMTSSLQGAAQQSLQATVPMKPTLHIYQGARINVFVAHDLSFYNVLAPKDED